MVLKLYNTLTRTKEEFRPLDANNVRMYVCGPTVYDYAHIGNARPVIVFDVLFRLLRHLYGADHVTYVRNITDVDDKINARAAEEGISIRELTERTAKQFHDDVAALGALPPTHEPRATEYIKNMIAMIERLIASGNAYTAERHVLYDVSSKPDYGKLSKRSLDEMIAGARVEVAPYKRNPMDFVLWKPSKPSEPSWPSPWSNGRPGWHIECSAMSEALLGETFDIHGGGIDLVFPHHENEIAQSEAAHAGHPFARVWMHNGFLQVEGEKMSKSLGNFFTIRELLDTTKFGGVPWTADAIRFAMLLSHYRQPIDWTANNLAVAGHNLLQFHWAGETHLRLPRDADLQENAEITEHEVSSGLLAALKDDLNTPAAITHLFSLASEIAKGVIDRASLTKQLLRDCLFLGIDPFRHHRLEFAATGLTPFEIEQAVGRRKEAKRAKNFSEADRIRDELAAKGIVLKDSPTGTTWDVSAEVAVRSRSAAAQNRLRAALAGNEGVSPVYVEPSREYIEERIAARDVAQKAKNVQEADRIRDELAAKGIVLKDSPSGTTWEVKR